MEKTPTSPCPKAAENGQVIHCPVATACTQLLATAICGSLAEQHTSICDAATLAETNIAEYLTARDLVSTCLLTDTDSIYEALPPQMAGLLNLFIIGVRMTQEAQAGWAQWDGMTPDRQ